MSDSAVEIDDYTRRGHERFRRITKLVCGDGRTRTFSEWLEWMKVYDPLAVQDKREAGPGIAKRPRPAKPHAEKKED